MNDAAAREFVEVAYGDLRCRARFFEVAAIDCGAGFFDQCARAISVGAVVYAPLLVLTYAFNR